MAHGKYAAPLSCIRGKLTCILGSSYSFVFTGGGVGVFMFFVFFFFSILAFILDGRRVLFVDLDIFLLIFSLWRLA